MPLLLRARPSHPQVCEKPQRCDYYRTRGPNSLFSYGFMRFRRCLPAGTSILVSRGESANRLPKGTGAAGLVQRAVAPAQPQMVRPYFPQGETGEPSHGRNRYISPQGARAK